jgi:hypothetical protein
VWRRIKARLLLVMVHRDGISCVGERGLESRSEKS